MFCQDELAREVRISKDNVAVNMKKWYLKNYEARFPHIKQDMEVITRTLENTVLHFQVVYRIA